MSVTGGPSSSPVEKVEERVGPYRLIRRLGQGGMGVVYLAEGPERQEVALKVLRPHVAHDETARARLQREASTLQKVSHPGVAGILDHDLEGDRPYLVTRFVPGRPLDEQVDDRGPLTPRKWLPLAGCLAESLQAIHAVGVIHRDLKPGNVMMLNGKPVMIDFGIAQAADDLRLTQTGLVIGTPGYLAPELIEGEDVSESADWWGWAATVTFAATGRRPFGKGPFEAVLHRVHTGQVDLEGMDPRLKTLLAAALAPKRADRPTQDEIMAGLTRYAEGRDALPPRASMTATVATHPPTRQMTRVLPTSSPDDAVTEITPPETDPEPSPTEVANLVPPVIPPLSAFAPLADKVRDAAAARKAAKTAAAGAAAGAPAATHPATYSPAPLAAAPPAMPLPYQQPYQTAPQLYQPPTSPYQPVVGTPKAVVPYEQRAVEPKPAERAPATGKRTAVVVGFMIALAGLIALFPLAGSLVAAVFLVVARTVDRGSTALMRRRQVRGRAGKSDGVVAVASSPAQLVAAALITLVCLLLPLLMGAVVGSIVTAIAATAQGLDWRPLSAVGFGAAALTALFTAWWGPGGSSLRRGAHITARNLFRPRWLASATAVLLLAGGSWAFYEATQGAGDPWARTPVQTPKFERPTFDDLRQAPLIRDLPLIGK
ncbi:serine/threonine protein kinase [Kribbella sandramycini]|uniref:Serine/threonine protein kinase n=1 Tax=Kribbella sandramycini TaxID=60450 RepID=A0A7Y4NYX7_9ACTN|nr:serine/threonine-protein kinase [Kribbella sandramycini]MBB6565163.1 serine/threonine protein kinase [Kribbella sandramycini]NOL41432.1 serine/threonine protein kinase [Kribbella sandramycini]